MTLDACRLQQRLPSHERRSWIVPAVIIAVGVFLVELLGLFEPFDDLAYDRATRFLAQRSLLPAEVLLVYASPQPSEMESDDLLALLDRLEEFRAMHVALAMPLPQNVVERCLNRKNITIGHTVVRDRTDPELFHPISRASLDATGSMQPAVVMPPPRHGIYREQLTQVAIDGKRRPTLESAVAQHLHNSASAGSLFRIRFRGGTGSLPHLTLESAINGGLVPELVSGKVVLIGRAEAPSHFGISTPTTDEFDQMPVLEFRGHALNTLVTRSAVESTGPGVKWLIYVAVAIIAGLFFERTTARGGGLLLLALLTIDVACMLLLLWSFRISIPAFEIATVETACFARIAFRRNAFAQSAWQQLIQNLHANLQQRRWPTSFFSEEEPWSQIVTFVHQTLNLNRLIILELPANSFHVREVKALNCALADIDEMRRDCRRWPYAAALEEKRPIGLDAKRPFLRLAVDEEQYLVPLVFGGEGFGFMALGVARAEIADPSEFERRLTEFADQIAELLYRRHRVLSERERESSWFSRFRQAADARIYSELVHATHLLERRMARLENMFDGSLTAAAIYDVFGRLMMVNARMAQLLQEEGVVATELTTVDLISMLTKHDQQMARHILRRVITENRHESVPVTLERHEGDYLFNVRPMELEVPDAQITGAGQSPLQLQGILCELVDRTDVVQTHRLRAQLTESFGNTLRNDFAAVDLAGKLIADETAPSEQRRACSDLIHSRIQAALKNLSEFEQMMPTDLYSDEEEFLPIAPVPILEEAIAAVAGQAKDRGIEIRVLRSPLISHAFAAPKLLPRVFEVILEFLMLDACDDSELGVGLEETPNEVVLTFANEGFGVAIDSVREFAEHEDLANIPESHNLREVLEQVNSWGGRMTSASEIGSGTSIKLILRKFH